MLKSFETLVHESFNDHCTVVSEIILCENMVSRSINSIQYRGETKCPPHPPPFTSFFLCNFTNVRISLKNITFSFNPIDNAGVNFQGHTLCQSQIVELNPRPLLKKWFFWSNRYNIEVMITCLIEMLELPNFGHMTTSTI